MPEEKRRITLKEGDYLLLLRDTNGYPKGCVIDLSSDYTRTNSGNNWIGTEIGPECSSRNTIYGTIIYNPQWEAMPVDKFLNVFMKGAGFTSNYVHIMTRLEIAEALENTNARFKFLHKQLSEKVEEFRNYPDRDTYIASKLVKKVSDVMDKNGKLKPEDLAPLIKTLNMS